MNNGKIYLLQQMRDMILAKAETRERRQKKLEHFFREAYALTFGLRPGERRRRSDEASGGGADGEVVTVMRTSLSKGEFASALGMKSDAVFVRKMFNIVDKDGDGRISFQVSGICLNIFLFLYRIIIFNIFFEFSFLLIF